jgi:hypothetical protein
MAGLLKAAASDESVLDAPLPGGKGSALAPQQQQTESEMSKLAKQGLPDNPKLEIIQMWAGRVKQDLAASTSKLPLTRDMMDLVSKSDISYSPLWNVPGGAILGSLAWLRAGLPAAQYNTGEFMRQDLSLLFAGVFQIYAMQNKGINAMVSVPVRAATLLDKEGGELYLSLIRHMSDEARKYLFIIVRDAPKAAPSANLVTAIDMLARLARAVIFETGILTYAEYGKHFPKLHAIGFDSAEARIDEQEQVRLLKKFVDHYKAQGHKTYVKSVSSKRVLDAAIAGDYAYVSGDIVRPAQKTAFLMQKLPVETFKTP